MVFPSIPIDGNWVDIGSAATGFIYIVICKFRRQGRVSLISKQTGLDFANGAALFPLLIMSCSVLSSKLVGGLVEASKMSLSVAGVFALLAILEDTFEHKRSDFS